MVAKFVCVPVFLEEPIRSKISRVEFTPGIYFKKSSLAINRAIQEHIDKNHITTVYFQPTHLVWIDTEKYRAELLKQLKAEGIDKTPESINKEFNDYLRVRVDAIARQALLGLSLIQNFYFLVGGYYSFSEQITTSGKKKYEVLSSSIGEYEKPTILMSYMLTKREMGNLNPFKLKRIAVELSKYYRPVEWHTDRMAIALRCYWSALCTTYADQAFIALATLLETLLSSGSEAVTHQISERAAILLTSDKEQRKKIYQEVKDVYNIRSRIAHGNAIPQKGAVTRDSLYIAANWAIVPENELEKLMIISTNLLKKVLSNPKMLKIIQSKKDQDRVSKDLTNFFLDLIFD